LGGGRVSGFANTDQRTSDEQKHKRGGEAAGNGGKAPYGDASGDDLGAAHAIREEPAGDTRDSKHYEKPSLQGTELCVG
jgi:hypothetical protein